MDSDDNSKIVSESNSAIYIKKKIMITLSWFQELKLNLIFENQLISFLMLTEENQIVSK